MFEPVFISTVALRAAIDEAKVTPEFRLAFTVGLTQAGVFDGETIDSIQLGMAIGRLVVNKRVSDGIEFGVMVGAIIALDKVPKIR